MEKRLSKELRLLGITRKEASVTLGVTTATISNWVIGTHPISPVGVRILNEMGVTKKAIRNPSEEI